MIRDHRRRPLRFLAAAALLLFGLGRFVAGQERNSADAAQTKTPIKHIVVLFQENVSFDHYFATYPYATNPSGEPKFEAKDGTPRVNNLRSGGLLDQNPNTAQPFRLDRSEALTCDQNHDYTPEQLAFDHGLMDKFIQNTGTGGPGCPDYGHGPGLVMGYYDGNTVTAMWNYAQHYALSDNNYGTMFGPSTVGALNLVAGTTSNATLVNGGASGVIANGASMGAVIGDPDPGFDDCSAVTKTHVTVTGTNIGELLSDKQLTWGWFQGGFAPTSVTAGKAACGATSTGLPGTVTDYVPHHNPFEYFSQTANQHHLPPSDDSKIGEADQANHQYDLSLFFTALNEGRLPSVSFLKAKALQNGHPGNSDPLDEQVWLATVVNAIAGSQYWRDTVIIITYDDSDGWYDHQMDTVVNQSDANDDALAAPGSCGVTPAGSVSGRCGYGPRLPFVVISPFAKQNYVDSRMIDQSSIIRFIEDNWDLGRVGGDSNDAKAGSLFGFFDFANGQHAPKLILDPSTGRVLHEE
ncbi:MAG: alkaline phosphatase family protein [Candidatus Acidiferrales bacterium]